MWWKSVKVGKACRLDFRGRFERHLMIHLGHLKHLWAAPHQLSKISWAQSVTCRIRPIFRVDCSRDWCKTSLKFLLSPLNLSVKPMSKPLNYKLTERCFNQRIYNQKDWLSKLCKAGSFKLVKTSLHKLRIKTWLRPWSLKRATLSLKVESTSYKTSST